MELLIHFVAALNTSRRRAGVFIDLRGSMLGVNVLLTVFRLVTTGGLGTARNITVRTPVKELKRPERPMMGRYVL